MLELIEEASKVLRTPPPEFDFENPPEDPKEIETNLSSAMEQFGGIGLSANQVGLNFRVFVMRTADNGTVAFFNPEITKVSQETDLMKEGCLSFPDLYLMIKRSKEIEFKYQNADGEEKVLHLTGLGARCVQHECDHLNGILFLQRASRLKLERAMKSRPKERKKRIDYETRIAYARAIQERESLTASESDNGEGIERTDSVSEDSRAS